MGAVGLAGRVVTAAVVVIEVLAVICQCVQTTDPRFPLVYFTVDSAVLAGLAAGIAFVRPRLRCLPALRITSTVGVVIAALVFAIVIAPATPTGTWIQPHDDVWVRTANILMHGVAPPLVCIGLPVAGVVSYLRLAYVWPLLYLAAIAALTWGGVEMPYPFLSPAHIGWAGVGAVLAALSALVAGVAAALCGIHRLANRVHGSPGVDSG